MNTRNPALVGLIRDEIRVRGPVSFAWFMQQALYHPEHGYYSSDRATIGRRGDYFTNVSVGPLFGQLLAIQFAEIWDRMGKPENFSIVEQGAHHGDFARDVLGFLRDHRPDFFSSVSYRIVEPFPKLQDRQRETVNEFGDRVQWRNSLPELGSFVGIHFSNELLDAMPVNLRNKRVGLNGDELIFVDWAKDEKPNQSQVDWVDSVATKLERGLVLAIDYGFAGAEFRETIHVRARHRLLDSPFQEIGNADITAHINWSDIGKAAENNDLRIAGFTDQHHFLTGIISMFPDTVTQEKSKRGLQTLLHPEMLGRSFQVLALSKDADFAGCLSGFKFARDPRKELGF